MQAHLRMGAAAATLCALCLSAVPAMAQTAVETVAFITLGVEASRAGSDHNGTREYASDGSETVTWRSVFPSGALIQDLTITEEEPCKYRITGQDFVARPYEHNIDRDITIDLTVMTPNQAFREFTKFPGDKITGQLKGYYFTVAGAKVCSPGQTQEGNTWERFPAQGECRQELQTNNFHDAAGRDRMLAALNHLRANFCKPRAF